jgi:hypothetical protein
MSAFDPTPFSHLYVLDASTMTCWNRINRVTGQLKTGQLRALQNRTL